MPLKGRDRRGWGPGGGSDGFEEDPSDYLRDPELWIDRLPQPFRTIDELLQELLASAWEAIEEREVARQLEQARVHIPEVSDARLLANVEGVQSVASGCGSLMFIGSATGVSVFDMIGEGGGGGEGGGWGEPLLVTQSGPPAMNCTDLQVSYVRKDDMEVHIIAATLDIGKVRIFAYAMRHLVHLADLSVQDEKEVMRALFAPSCTHLAAATNSGENGWQLELHGLPLDAWLQELRQYLAAVSANGGGEKEVRNGSQSNVETAPQQHVEATYSKPTHLMSISIPGAPSPCTASDPATALSSVFEGCSEESLPAGDHHVVMTKYFENRRKNFVSRRVDFVTTEPNPCISYKQSSPTCHFVYYKNACRHALPCYLAVWWKGHTQLFIYPVEDTTSTKGLPAAVPRWVFPQGAAVCASAASCDGGLLAVGRQSGVVSIWDMRQGVCTRTVSAINSPDGITSMEFIYPTVRCRPVLAVGSKRGKVVTISSSSSSSSSSSVTKAHNEIVISLSERVSKQREAYRPLFQSSGYDCGSEVVGFRHNAALPSTVLSVHADGSLILWSCAEREGLCTLRLPQDFTVHGDACTFTSAGSHAAIVGKLESDESSTHGNLFCVALRSLPQLRALWTDQGALENFWPPAPKQPTPMDRVESTLDTVTKLRYKDRSQFDTRRTARWTEFTKELHVH